MQIVKFKKHPQIEDWEVADIPNPSVLISLHNESEYCRSLSYCRPSLLPGEQEFACPRCQRKIKKPEYRVCEFEPLERPMGVGTIFAQLTRGKPCERCEETRKRMNRLGPDGCQANFLRLVDEVYENAKHHPSIKGMIAKALPKQEVIETIEGWLIEAIDRARS